MITPPLRRVAWLVSLLISLTMLPVAAVVQTDQDKLVAAAENPLDNFVRAPDMTWIQQNSGRAKGVSPPRIR
jgi:hypothetical protein